MSISREYYDADGNYWQIETPYYIPPKEAIKNPTYVRGFVSAEKRKRCAAAVKFREWIGKFNRVLEWTTLIMLVIVAIVILCKG